YRTGVFSGVFRNPHGVSGAVDGKPWCGTQHDRGEYAHRGVARTIAVAHAGVAKPVRRIAIATGAAHAYQYGVGVAGARVGRKSLAPGRTERRGRTQKPGS